MAYLNIVRATTYPAEEGARVLWGESESSSTCKKHVLARGVHLVLIPGSFVAGVVDTVIGVVAGIGSFLTCGSRMFANHAEQHLKSSAMILSRPYANLMLAINPTLSKQKLRPELFDDDERDFSITHFVINKFSSSFRDQLVDCDDSDNFFYKHVVSRLTFVLLTVADVVARVADGIICLPVAAASILTFGCFERLNDLALGTLQAPGLIGDLYFLGGFICKPFSS